MRLLCLLPICLLVAAPAGSSPMVAKIANAGFEETAPGNAAPGWGWYARAKVSFRSETANPHSGARCLAFTDESPIEPEVYGRLFQGVPVLPDTEYELSVWVRGEAVAQGIHFTDWSSYMLTLPEGTYGWQRVSTRFRTKPGEAGLNLGINVVNLCKVLAIDDISLRPIGTDLKGRGVEGTFLVPGQVQGDNQTASLRVAVTVAGNAEVEGNIRAGEQVLFAKREPLKAGENVVEWQWSSSDLARRELECIVRVRNDRGKLLASARQTIRKLSPRVLSADIDRAEARLKGLDALIARCRERRIPVDYPMATRTMLEQMIPFAREDAQKHEEARADHAARDFHRSLDRAMAELRACLKDPRLAPNVRRYRTGKLAIDGVSFIGDREDTRGARSRGPVFFNGYGHFIQVRKDIPRFPGYGVNLIQIELGPSAVLTGENEVSLKATNEVLAVLDRAAEQHVMVNILLSPHYFPGWATAKWPDLLKGGGGFLGFCVDAPEAKAVVEKHLRTVVPLLRAKPALHSFCLTNEPILDRTAGAPNTRPMWAAYLERVHGDVAAMNARYGTRYASFADVPVPGNDAFAVPQYYDYCVFNQERFAGWHRWMADIIHEMAPEVPVHAKIMDMMIPARHTVSWGVDPEAFGELSQINGNDCTMWPGGGGGWSISWHVQSMMYDLQRSVAFKPIFNSENHLITDRSTGYVPPEHVRTALWQGAVHGQGATTIWVWERAFERGSDFYGSIAHRPGCAEAVGRTCLDLNRFAEAVTALQTARAPVAILFSIASITRDGAYLGAMGQAYAALNFCGVKVDFVSEKQLAAGRGAGYRMVIVPQATHLPEAAARALAELSGRARLVVLGDAPSKNPYGQGLPAESAARIRDGALALPRDMKTDALWQRLQAELSAVEALPEVSVVGTDGKPIWGVEWLPAEGGGRRVVNLVNLTDKPVDVRLTRRGRRVSARDILSLGGRAPVRRLEPMVPVLASLR